MLPTAIIDNIPAGVVHAPFASGRAFLYESDFDQATVLAQTNKKSAGRLALVNASALVPDVPKFPAKEGRFSLPSDPSK